MLSGGLTSWKSAVFLGNDDGQQHTGLYWQECSQHTEGSNPSSPFGISERAPGVVLGSPVPAEPRHTAVRADKGPQEGEGTGTPCTRRGWENFSLLTEGVGKAEPVSPQRCTVIGHEAAVTSCQMGIPVKYKHIFLRCEGNQTLGKAVPQRLWKLEIFKARLGLALFRP